MQNQTIFCQPSQALIDNWKIWMAYEVVQHWQTVRSLPEFNPKEIFDIDIKVFSRTCYRLDLKVQELKSKTDADGIESAVNEIKTWLLSGIKKLEEPFQKLMYEGREKLLNFGTQKINPQELLELLSKLNSPLQIHKSNLEKEKDVCMTQKNSSWDSYKILFQKLKLLDSESLSFNNNLEGIWKALSIHFISKLKVEICTLYLRVLDSLQQQIQSLYDAVKLSAMFLVKIKSSLEEDCSIEIVSTPIFTYLHKIDVNMQRNLLEIWIGHSISFWGRTSIVSWQKVKEKLLSNLEPVAREFCQDFLNNFFEQTEIIPINTSNTYQFKELEN